MSIIILYILNNYCQGNQTTGPDFFRWHGEYSMSALLGGDNGQPTGKAVRCRHRAGEASADARGLPRPALCVGELLASWMPNNGLPVCAIA